MVFELEDNDYAAINAAVEILRLALGQVDMTGLQVVGAGRALHALERLPASTPGVHVEMSIACRIDSGVLEEMRYVSIMITEDAFELSFGGSVYDPAVGSDSIPGGSWYIERDGTKSVLADPDYVQDLASELLGLGGRVDVLDESVHDP